MGFCLALACGLPAGAQVLGPAEVPPAGFAGDLYTDSAGCLFVRGSANGTVVWLPRLDAQRRPVCAPRDTAQVPAPPAGPDPAAQATADLAVGPAAAPGPAAPPPEPDPAQLALPGPLAPLAPQAAPGGLVADAPPGLRLIFVEPDDRLRIVHVDLPSVLIGGDIALGDLDPDRGARVAQRRSIPGHVQPRPALLAAAPPIRGFGPDPEPLPRPRRAVPPAPASGPWASGPWASGPWASGPWASGPWDGSSPAPLPGDARPPRDDPGPLLVTRATTAALWGMGRD